MWNLLGRALPAFILALTLLVDARPVAAKPDYTRRAQRDCSFCHVPPGYGLNEAGKYYRDHKHSLKGFEPPKPKSSH